MYLSRHRAEETHLHTEIINTLTTEARKHSKTLKALFKKNDQIGVEYEGVMKRNEVIKVNAKNSKSESNAQQSEIVKKFYMNQLQIAYTANSMRLNKHLDPLKITASVIRTYDKIIPGQDKSAFEVKMASIDTQVILIISKSIVS